MNIVSSKELKVLLESNKPVQLVMALGHWHYDRLHIPGSLMFENVQEAARQLSRDQEVVVYCSGPACPASYRFYQELKHQGFTKISYFSGGIEGWMKAGFPVEGSQVKERTWAPA